MKSLSAYDMYIAMRDAKKVEEEKQQSVIADAHPDTVARVLEMQQERVPCTNCGAVTKTDVHVEYRGGISVFTRYVCPRCRHEFMEKDLHGQ